MDHTDTPRPDPTNKCPIVLRYVCTECVFPCVILIETPPHMRHTAPSECCFTIRQRNAFWHAAGLGEIPHVIQDEFC